MFCTFKTKECLNYITFFEVFRLYSLVQKRLLPMDLTKTSDNKDESDKYSVDTSLQKSVCVINSKQMFGLKTLMN